MVLQIITSSKRIKFLNIMILWKYLFKDDIASWKTFLNKLGIEFLYDTVIHFLFPIPKSLFRKGKFVFQCSLQHYYKLKIGINPSIQGNMSG